MGPVIASSPQFMSSPIAEADKATRKEMINIIQYDQQHFIEDRRPAATSRRGSWGLGSQASRIASGDPPPWFVTANEGVLLRRRGTGYQSSLPGLTPAGAE
jgi:hypothetical protein